jgi:outer membrane protein TolC
VPLIEDKPKQNLGNIDFLRLLEAPRQRLMLQEKRAEAIAEYHRRLAELERAVAGPIPRIARPEELPGELLLHPRE